MNEDKHEVICHLCFGKGFIPEEGYAECPYCDVTGFYEEYDYDVNEEEYNNIDEYEKEQNLPRIKGFCGQCKKIMTPECMLCSFDIDGYCTGGPNDDFYCADFIASDRKCPITLNSDFLF